jgi:hypothetical protein
MHSYAALWNLSWRRPGWRPGCGDRPAAALGAAICNLYDYEMTPEIMASIIEHRKLIGKEWSEAMRMRNAPNRS